MYEIKTLEKKSRHIRKFVNLEFKLYKGDKNWVAPLKSDTIKILKGKKNPLFQNELNPVYQTGIKGPIVE